MCELGVWSWTLSVGRVIEIHRQIPPYLKFVIARNEAITEKVANLTSRL
jgi:hypothetical protein